MRILDRARCACVTYITPFEHLAARMVSLLYVFASYGRWLFAVLPFFNQTFV